jgi:hypothetical protein
MTFYTERFAVVEKILYPRDQWSAPRDQAIMAGVR